MTFSEALEQMAKGRVVSRRSSPLFAVNGGIAARSAHDGKRLHRCRDGRWESETWLPASEDIFAMDWEVVEAVPPNFSW